MAFPLPSHEFVTWLKQPALFIEGYKLIWNKKFVKADSTELHYFYCSNKNKFKCKKSAKASLSEDQSFLLYAYSGQHSEMCRPSSSFLHIKKIRDAIKAIVLSDPTVRPSAVYHSEVFRVRDTLSDGEKVEFDNLMPTQHTMNSSIFAWKRMVIPAAPECVSELDTSGPFFTLENGENMVKYDTSVNGDPNRRLIFMTSDKIMQAVALMGTNGVMDATFKVIIFEIFHWVHIFTHLKETKTFNRLFLSNQWSEVDNILNLVWEVIS